MRAMLFEKADQPLALRDMPKPALGPGKIRIRVRACAVCRTDLHIVEGDLRNPKLPLIPGHEIIGVVDKMGAGVKELALGDRVGVPWLGHSCGQCRYCLKGRENLCEKAEFTGYTRDGGFADYTVADARYCFPIPQVYSDEKSGAADVRRPDRLSLLSHGRRCATHRPLRFRRRGAHHRAGCGPSKT